MTCWGSSLELTSELGLKLFLSCCPKLSFSEVLTPFSSHSPIMWMFPLFGIYVFVLDFILPLDFSREPPSIKVAPHRRGAGAAPGKAVPGPRLRQRCEERGLYDMFLIVFFFGCLSLNSVPLFAPCSDIFNYGYMFSEVGLVLLAIA